MPTIGDVTENNYYEIREEIEVEEELSWEEGVEEDLQTIDVEEPQDNKIETKEIEEIDYKIALKELGYYKEDYQSQDINMRNAVVRFQSDHNLIVDGSFGPVSLRTLEKRMKDDSFEYPDVIDHPPTDKEWIVINKTNRILTFYRGNEVIKKYPIAQGKEPSFTPEGKFTIANKMVNPRWGGAGIAAPVAGGSPNNPLGYRWMGLSYRGGGSIGIHGNNSPTSIGTNASLGCIRMINSDVEELFELVKLNIPVWVGSHEKLQQWGVHNKSYIN